MAIESDNNEYIGEVSSLLDDGNWKKQDHLQNPGKFCFYMTFV